METFLGSIFDIGQCQLMVINNDNTNNGRYEKNHFRPVVLTSQKLLTHPKIPHPFLPLKKKIIVDNFCIQQMLQKFDAKYTKIG
jgi:hypothetical protein